MPHCTAGRHDEVSRAEVALPGFVGLELFRLDGQVALITGGGGAIGTAMAGGFASAGAAILIADRRPDAAEAPVAALKDTGVDALAVEGDVTSEADVQRTVRAAVERWGRLDVLVNGAGIGARPPAEGYPLDRWQSVLDIN